MLWVKAFHLIFMVTWFAGLFYLPRLFIYHVESQDTLSHERFVVMERRLFAIMTLGAVLTACFGLWLLFLLGGLQAPHWYQGWWYAKIVLLALLIAYHVYCWHLMSVLRQGGAVKSSTWYRWYNEVPAFFLLAIIILVVVRPF